MKSIFIFLISIFFTPFLFSYEYNFTDSSVQKKLFINSLPYSSTIEACINKIAFEKNYLLIDNKEFIYVDESKLVSSNCNNDSVVIENFKDKVKSEIVFKNRLYIYVNNSIWVTNGSKDETHLLKGELGLLTFNTTNYNLYILEYPAPDELNIYTVNSDYKSLKKVLKGVSIASSRFAHFVTPNLYVTRMGTLFKMDEITFEVKVVNDQYNVFYPSFIIPLNDKLLHFVSEKGEIYVSDGTKEGTKRIKTFRDKRRDVYFRLHSLYDDKISFLAIDNKRNESLYETDGTVEGTVVVK